MTHDERIAQAVHSIVILAEEDRVALTVEAPQYFKYCGDPLTPSEQQEVLAILQCGHSMLKRADGACMCDQHRILRGELDTRAPEAPCCVPNAHGACSSTCPRVAALRKGRTA